jgi:hypothetical protein
LNQNLNTIVPTIDNVAKLSARHTTQTLSLGEFHIDIAPENKALKVLAARPDGGKAWL